MGARQILRGFSITCWGSAWPAWNAKAWSWKPTEHVPQNCPHNPQKRINTIFDQFSNRLAGMSHSRLARPTPLLRSQKAFQLKRSVWISTLCLWLWKSNISPILSSTSGKPQLAEKYISRVQASSLVNTELMAVVIDGLRAYQDEILKGSHDESSKNSGRIWIVNARFENWIRWLVYVNSHRFDGLWGCCTVCDSV